MKTSVFEEIQCKIKTVSGNAVNTYNSAKVGNLTDDMYRLGFTESVSVVSEYKKLNQDEMLRARLIRYFGNGMVMMDSELRKFETQYKLVTHVASRFKDAIPDNNQMDIVQFAETLKKEKWNQGRVETELYHIPITDPFLITAPNELFREALSLKEMSPAEYKKWQEEDPIVWKKIFRFNPSTQENVPTKWLRQVTAWGLEAVLINRN